MLFKTFLVWLLSILIVPNLVVRVVIVDATTSTTNHHHNINKSLKENINKNKKTYSKKPSLTSEEQQQQQQQHLLYPYLGPLIKEDEKLPKKRHNKNYDDNDIPINLEYIGYEIDVPVGYRRLRWAMLHDQSQFVSTAFYDKEMKYTKIKIGKWNDTSLSKVIGHPTLLSNKLSKSSTNVVGIDSPSSISNCIASKEIEYHMPKSTLIPANTCYEKSYLIEYNDSCFCLRKRARTPGAPFGKTYVAWTQYTVIDNGNNSCHIICSVEPEFICNKKNILMTRPIRNGMRSGTNEVFRSFVKTINQYANVYP